MSKTIKEERLRWVLPLIQKEIRLVDAAKVCPYGKRSLERWVVAYREGGEKALEPKSTEPKRYRTETLIWLKEKILAIRTETKKCAREIHWQLEKEGIKIDTRTIGKILKKEGLVRKYRVKRTKYKYFKAELKSGELVEIDVKYVPGMIAGQQYFQYTAVDRASRWRHLEIYDEQINLHSVLFLETVIGRAPFTIQAIKTDNHATFTNYYTGTNKRSDLLVKSLHALDEECRKRGIKTLLDRSGQAGAERNRRTEPPRRPGKILRKK